MSKGKYIKKCRRVRRGGRCLGTQSILVLVLHFSDQSSRARSRISENE